MQTSASAGVVCVRVCVCDLVIALAQDKNNAGDVQTF